MIHDPACEKNDDQSSVKRMAKRLLNYRIFPDHEGRMNKSLSDINGDLLLVPNFTVAANTQKGTRASFSTAASPKDGKRLFDALAHSVRQQHDRVETGAFGADIQITLTNGGPVIFILQS
ncbi:MAG: D-aminoacyl-tRNA deacylase [Mariprofundus sp.]|nr:D-aminoacyl-tRNA deacylase [Mariprofundus sp.]